ncbi:hypothetical protein HO345_12155 [Treponema denticola]|uniref:Swt1 family HEPN domain-containing protein n=1 Tax=Treponema denticola TaxID=158 RepID=UPI0020A38940|nr:Swt1 family HEPN domain-containing protein [Treponema denticola]UTD13673.1 hypothetical protein HO345_12155 [Treponema denticola]
MKDFDSFVLRGIFTSYAIKDMQANGTLVSPTLTHIEKKEIDLYSSLPEKIRSGSLEMSKYYRYLFALENTLRDFINDVFTENKGIDWFDTIASSDMKRKIQQRKDKEIKNRWHIGRNPQSIYYLDFGDLGLLITNNWELFKFSFPDQHWINNRMNECERSRNVIAHTNIIDSQEAERLTMYLRDIIKQIA